VGAKFTKMLEMGASKPWPDALEAFTGTREMGWLGAGFLLRAAADVAEGTEQGPDLRLVRFD